MRRAPARMAVELEQIRAEARRADQPDRLKRRGPLHVEARAVALLDRRHGRRLPAPCQRPDDRESGGDGGNLRHEERHCSSADRHHEQGPQPVENGSPGVELRQHHLRARAGQQRRDLRRRVRPAPEPDADQAGERPPPSGEGQQQVIVRAAGAGQRDRAEHGRGCGTDQDGRTKELGESHQSAASSESSCSTPLVPSTTISACEMISEGPSSERTPTLIARFSRPSCTI